MVWSKSMYRESLSSFLIVILGLGLTSDVSAKQSSISWQSRLNNIWSRIIKDDTDQEPPWGSRGPICTIAPTHIGANTPEIWHNQPIIVWKSGSVAKVSLAIDSEAPVWEYIPSADETYVVYDGEPLKAGEIYTLGVHISVDEGPVMIPTFQVLSAETRTLISDELESFSTPNELAVSDAEWEAIQQAEYFANDYPYDAVQSLFNVSEPSAELLELQETIIEKACTHPEE